MINGFISIDKPPFITAHDCVSKLRKLLKQKKIGHGGTLDPMATGVLPIAVGNATRLLRFLPAGKAYVAKIRFGLVTNTDDITGEVISDRPCPNLTLTEIQKFLSLFQGKITQRPPAFSAIQVNGKRLYDLARRGEITLDDVPMREVDITDIRVLNWAEEDYPELDVAIACGSGTYIRSIARDLGEKLGCGATLSGLRRTYSNGFDLNSSLSFEQIAELLRSGNFEVLAPDHGLHFLPMLFLDENATKRWCMGQVIAIKDVLAEGENILSQFVRMCDRNQNFLGVSEVIESGLQPIVVLNPIN
ncbi:MAG: tRNA pseudouridine(55) synthase TruB [Pseudanabaena sp.]|jgi:tRNA pseudouridine55 synthase|nr:tRNA pseudouridine(55) synthase TruB [Pseudanabaena sp. M090S1SP2A07QC]MCA6508795.1 tRNA pseudouridine(55) synthase TruB [Pseudanabaena sp. M109S1SP2A07QC]MCA6517441.1 tRNA pseudouridine(55) synthase TruB [Pseudanabaena sp. M110S1SP2A07QC]MCA6524147.1 tRNA pseudouridine(55) synthase TruB [Pseudanabaena sp. M051S1SP2A07QC]MCA6526882.1 tRNA pseudouridine(55) synthase TruB [Pseudanabaena sp. M179S2SP2A07QC]MCA6531847.1 tRNA pseudouridine(55) synthase TruB [Pseudanabaena sp. M125S2SP2A07QC]MCA